MPRLTAHARRALIEERRQQILTAAAAVFAEKGFDRATISDVARAAGLADGSIYNYFRDKQDLLVHLPHQFIRPPVEALRAARGTDTPATAEALLQGMAQNIVNVITQNRELARVLFTSIPFVDQDLRVEYMRQVPLYALEALEEYITAQQAAGVFRADLDAAIAARAFPGLMLFFLLVQEILQPPKLPRFEYAEVLPQVVQIFLHGVIAAEPTPSALAQKTDSKRRAPARKLRAQKSPARRTRKHSITVE
jgi:TetR/AcrR family fatty acid metabolism transcriptional regulator